MFRFTIRDLLLATVIAALAIGWWIDRSRLAPKAAESDTWKFRAESLAERVQPNGWQVKWDDDEILITQTAADGTMRSVSRNRSARPISQAEIQAWLAKPAPPGTPRPAPMAAQPAGKTSSR
jgi:hypothetical protein